MLFTPRELFDLALMIFIVGFIFKDFFIARPRQDYDPLKSFRKRLNRFEGLKFSILITAPAIVLHELAHKFVAIYFGQAATFHAAYLFLMIGFLLRFFGSPIIFFVPGYVTHSALAPAAHTAMIAVAGPAMNLLLFIGAWLAIKNNWLDKKYLPVAVITKKINLFLFFFNMLPIRPFDGGHFFHALMTAL